MSWRYRFSVFGHVVGGADRRGLIAVIGIAAVEQTLQSGEMVLTGWLALEVRRGGVLAQCVRDDCRRHMLQSTSRPHRVELHLAGALEVIEAVIGFGHCFADY